MRVVATQKGYYGSKIREPDEEFGLTDAEHFAKEWMEPVKEPIHPLDHDGDGRKGGSKPRSAAVQASAETEVTPPAEPAKTVDPITGDDI